LHRIYGYFPLPVVTSTTGAPTQTP
jgi:hypothetical protein